MTFYVNAVRESESWERHRAAAHSELLSSDDGVSHIVECEECRDAGRAYYRWKVTQSEVIPLYRSWAERKP